jgi:hypothetical protein
MTNLDMYKIKVVKCCNDSLANIRSKMGELLGTTNLQSYFPILENYFSFYNGSKCDFTLKTRFRLLDILEKKDHKIDDSYIKNFITCLMKDVTTNEEKNIDIFVKTLPLLNVTHYLTNEYRLASTILPNSYYQDTIKKINNPNNSAYIDVFFSYLGSRLSETGKCPTFPIFYGTYSGIMKEFKIDISEDYDDLKDEEDFIHMLGDSFSLEDAKIEQEPLVNEDLLNEECIIEVDDVEDVLNDINGSSLDISLNDSDVDIDIDIDIDIDVDVDVDANSNSDADVNSNSDVDANSNSDADVNSNSDADIDNASETGSDGKREDGIWEDIDENEEGDESIIDIETLIRDEINNDIKILDSDCSFSDISDSSTSSEALKYAKIPNFPVQFNFIESLDGTLDNYIDNAINKKITPTEWKSILFQICFGLAVGQKHFLFVHNDLHSSNIMFKKTEKEYLYYKFGNKFFRIPTFNKISKIIDFGRATFKVGNKIYFSDVFMKNEDAWGQYTYPNSNSTLKHCKIKPNMSFDLSRFATTIIERFEYCDEQYDDIKNLLNLWMTDRYGNDLSELEEDFDLYKIIARNVKSAQPKSQLNKKIWEEFIVEESEIPKSEFIYKF